MSMLFQCSPVNLKILVVPFCHWVSISFSHIEYGMEGMVYFSQGFSCDCQTSTLLVSVFLFRVGIESEMGSGQEENFIKFYLATSLSCLWWLKLSLVLSFPWNYIRQCVVRIILSSNIRRPTRQVNITCTSGLSFLSENEIKAIRTEDLKSASRMIICFLLFSCSVQFCSVQFCQSSLSLFRTSCCVFWNVCRSSWICK